MPPLQRTVRIARTAHDLTHVNRLRVPEFGVVRISVGIGGKSSKPYRPANAPAPKDADTGTDDFHFCPEKEEVEIRYEIDDFGGNIDEATLEMFCRYEDAPLWTLDLTKLGWTWYAHGKHLVKWDGRVVVQPTVEKVDTETDQGWKHDLTAFAPDKRKDDGFPDGYVNLGHTTYKLKLTVKSGGVPGRATVSWTYFHIIIKSIELELGPEETVPAAVVDDAAHKRNKAVRARIATDGGVPGKDAVRKVFLVSNLFKTDSGQMGSDTGFTNFQTLWGDGPQIPVVAKIRIADSNDAEVKLESAPKGAVAMGNARFLWDWQDPDEPADASNTQPKPKAYIKTAIDYYKAGTDRTRSGKDHTYPKGDNCHVDRGGKRGPDAAAVFPVQAGYDPKDPLDAGKFPFEVEACTERKWAALSRGWGSGAMKGRTGVVFRPSRMAGDDYKLTVFLAYDKTEDDKWALDKKDEPLAALEVLRASTGTFQVWREIHVVRYIRKLGSVGSFWPAQVEPVRALYRTAYVQVEDKVKGTDSYLVAEHRVGGTAPDYNAICDGIFTGSGNALFTNQLAIELGADHKAVAAAFKARAYADFVTKVHEYLHGGEAGDFATAGVAAAALCTTDLNPLPVSVSRTRLGQTQSQLNTLNTTSNEDYCEKLDNVMFPLAKVELTNALSVVSGAKDGSADPAPEGITVLHFDNVHSAGPGVKLGSAIDPTDATAEKCVFLFTIERVDTFVHEIGHHLFLAHAPNAAGFKADTHDAADANCMMSYTRPRLAFCGQCQLRLRGWQGSTLSKTGASNKKP